MRALGSAVIRRPWLLAAIFVAAYGIRTTDVAEFQIIASAPFHVGLPPDHQFLYGSPLTFFLGGYYLHHGLPPGAAFAVVQIIGAALLLVGFKAALESRVAPVARGAVTVVLLSSPLLFVLSSFVGKSDTYLLAFLFLLTATESRATSAVLAALTVLCHRELGGAVLLSYALLHRDRRGAILLGGSAAALAITIYTQVLLSQAPSSRLDYAVLHAGPIWHNVLAHPLLHVVFTFGPFWLFVVTRRRFPPAWTAVAALAFVLAAATADFTRVFVIVAAPLLFEIAAQVGAEVTDGGGLVVGAWHWSAAALWPLVFVQLHLAGPKIFWARGAEWVLGR
jgi:hypothetical protein